MEEVVKAAAVLVERAGPDRLDAERGEAKSDELLAVDDARREAGESELNAANVRRMSHIHTLAKAEPEVASRLPDASPDWAATRSP